MRAGIRIPSLLGPFPCAPQLLWRFRGTGQSSQQMIQEQEGAATDTPPPPTPQGRGRMSSSCPRQHPVRGSLACILEDLDRDLIPSPSPALGLAQQQLSTAPSKPRVNPWGLYFHFFLAGRNFLLLRKTSFSRAMNQFQGVRTSPSPTEQQHDELNGARLEAHGACFLSKSPRVSGLEERGV